MDGLRPKFCGDDIEFAACFSFFHIVQIRLDLFNQVFCDHRVGTLANHSENGSAKSR